MKKTCPTCKNDFSKGYTESIKLWNIRRIYCSKDCMKGATPKVEITCKECKKVFAVQNYRKDIALFCSRKCFGKNKVNPNNPVNYAIRHKKIYIDWRKAIFERDNYTCVFCGYRGGELNADHIKSLRDIVNENNLDSIEKMVNCEKLWDLNNGRTLCVPCHKTTDTYGFKIWRTRKVILAAV